MNKFRKTLLAILLTAVFLSFAIFIFSVTSSPEAIQVVTQPQNATDTTESIDQRTDAAIARVKSVYPELLDYPSDKLPPRSIIRDHDNTHIYLAFVQNGSGRPIISARCFKIDKNNILTETGSYTPMVSDDRLVISPRTCK